MQGGLAKEVAHRGGIKKVTTENGLAALCYLLMKLGLKERKVVVISSVKMLYRSTEGEAGLWRPGHFL